MDTYTVEFRIENQSLIPSEVTNILKLKPCQTSDVMANTNSKRKRIPFWAYDGLSTENNFIEQDWKSLEEGLLFLLDKLLPKSNLIHSKFDDYKKYLWCACFQDSFDGNIVLSSSLLNKLADLNVEIIIKNYKSG